MNRCCFVLLLVFLAVSLAGEAPDLREPDWLRVSGLDAPPVLAGRAAILVEVESQTVLYSLNPDLVIPPASLTKLVAIDTALTELERGTISLYEPFSPPEIAWAENQPPGSSLMFLGADQQLTMHDLLLGLAVSSGNDAAVALAEIIDGGVPAFAERMNATMRELGLVDAFFVEPSGLSPRNTITARSFARFLLAHLERFPGAIDDYYSVKTYTYPGEGNRIGAGARLPITQANRNALLWELDGVDGFKTGFIDESGYNLAATAERGGRRLIVIVLGVEADSHALGGTLRARDAAALLEYGFDSFTTLRLGYPEPSPVRVYRGTEREVVLEGPQGLIVSVPAGSEDRIEGRIDQRFEAVAPMHRAVVGEVTIDLDGAQLAAEPLVLPAQEEAGFWRRLWDSIALAFRRIGARLRGEVPPATADQLGAMRAR